MVRPLPLRVDIADPGDCTAGASVDPDGIFLATDGKVYMTVTLYEYDLYDMVDVAALVPGDVIELQGYDILLESVEHTDYDLVALNGGLERGGYDLVTNGDGVYYIGNYDGVKSWLALGTVTLPVNEDFTFIDECVSGPQAEVWYVGDFLQPGAQLPTGLTAHNTTVTIQNGQVIELFRAYVR